MMRMMLKAVLSVVLVSALAPLAWAQEPPPMPQGPEDGPRRGREMGPRSGRPAFFRSEGRMGPMGRMRGHGDFGLARLLSNPQFRERLGVSTEQAAKIRQEDLNFRKAEIRNRADLEVKHMELEELLAADKADRAAIDKKLREISETRYASEKSGIDHHLAMKEALTPEQREKLKQMFAEMRTRRGEGNFPRMQRGPEGMGPRGPRGNRPAGPQPSAPPQKPPSNPDN